MNTTKMIDTALKQLREQRATRKDDLDLPGSMTPRERNSYHAITAELDRRIRAIEVASSTLASLPPIEPYTKWLDLLTTGRDTISSELLSLPRRIRDRATLDLQANLMFSLDLTYRGLNAGQRRLGPVVDLSPLRIGQLMIAAGYDVAGPALRGPNGWLGSMPEVEKLIKDLTTRRAEAQAALDEALLSDEDRAARETEHARYRATLNGMNIRNNSEGTGLVVVDEDGEERDLATLTEPERSAFTWFEAKTR